jgi:hypothetical protein
VPKGKRVLALPLVPVKYVFEQARSYKNFLAVLSGRMEQRLRNLLHPRRQATQG